MNRVSASKIVALRVAKARAKGRGKGSDGDQVDLFEAEGGRKYSRQYRRSKEKELQAKGKGGGPKVFGKARFSSRSEAGRYAANMRWRGRTGDLTNTLTRDFKTWDELSSGERKKVKSFVRNLDRGMGSVTDPKYYYKRQPNSFDFRSGVTNPTNYEYMDSKRPGEGMRFNVISDRSQIGDREVGEKVVEKLQREHLNLKLGTGIRNKNMKVFRAFNRLQGAKEAQYGVLKADVAKVYKKFLDEGFARQKEYEYASNRVRQETMGNDVRQRMIDSRDNNEAFARDSFDKADGARTVFEERFGEDINTYLDSQG